MNTPEYEGYILSLQENRADVLKLCEGLPAEALNWKPPAQDTNSIFALVTHIAGSESFWIQQVVGGIDVGRDRKSEFVASGDDLSALRQRLETIGEGTETVLRGLSEADGAQIHETPLGRMDTRACILHSISHMSIHIGHIQLTRQLWENMNP
jgi:uncharacterized damage-inducible protein DinB